MSGDDLSLVDSADNTDEMYVQQPGSLPLKENEAGCWQHAGNAVIIMDFVEY